MKILGLLRHAKSDWDDISRRDFDRGVNERGLRGARLMGAHVRDCGVRWQKLLASPAERVKRTLEAALPDLTASFDERLYLASADTLFDVLREEGGEAGSVLLAGHNPGLQELLFELVAPANENALFDEAAAKFPTATYAVLRLDTEDWAELKQGSGTLTHFARPRDLDPALGPES